LGETKPSASQARSAEEDMPRRRATSEMRRTPLLDEESDSLGKFFLLDTGPGFL